MLTTYTPKATVSLGAEAEHAHRQHKDSGQRAKDGWHHCRSEIPEGVWSDRAVCKGRLAPRPVRDPRGRVLSSGQCAKDGWHHCRPEIPEGVWSAQGFLEERRLDLSFGRQ